MATVKNNYKVRLRVISHLIILGGLLVFQFLPLIYGISFPYHYWLKQAIFYVLWVGIFYGNLSYLIPKLLYNHRAVSFFITLVTIIVAMIFINHKVDENLEIKARLKAHFHLDKDIGKESDIISDSSVIIITLLLIGCSTIMGVTTKMQHDALLRKDLESDKLSAELAFLKAQINPHFLFNTLNSIFVLTAQNDQAHQAVYNLSKMLRYVLYDTEGKQTTISNEILFLKEYLSLMKLRLTDNVTVTFTVPEQMDDHTIAAMLFLPLVENAFKHGISGTEESIISFNLLLKDTKVSFTATNSVFPVSLSSHNEEHGIGLTNTRRRLELLYPDRYSFETKPDTLNHLFTVTLNIDLS